MKILLMVFCLFSLNIYAQKRINTKNQNIELGRVNWLRNYDEAINLSKETGKPILILFQEVPGCSTCKNYGKNVLSHPLMVESIENEFIPLAIHNNKKGHDAQILKWFNEPSWNNPVVRIINANGANIVPRVSGNYTSIGLYRAMEQALIQKNRPIPDYMRLLKQELK